MKQDFWTGKLILAPMAGFGDRAMRQLARECGAGLTVTEMVSVKGLCYRNAATAELLLLGESETPSCVQLFGSQPEDFDQAIRDERLAGFDIIDINMGCPMPKIFKEGAGSALMRDPRQASKIIEAAVLAAQGRAVTVKTRLGWSDKAGAGDFVKMCFDSGASAVAVHARTATQMYSGIADYDAIAALASRHKRLILSGDVGLNYSIEDAFATGAAAVMIGRAALGNCSIFGTSAPKSQLLLRHVQLMRQYFDDAYTLLAFRKHFSHYSKGFPGAKSLREFLNTATTIDSMLNLLKKLPNK